jgi:hypothetical protein
MQGIEYTSARSKLSINHFTGILQLSQPGLSTALVAVIVLYRGRHSRSEM